MNKVLALAIFLIFLVIVIMTSFMVPDEQLPQIIEDSKEALEDAVVTIADEPGDTEVTDEQTLTGTMQPHKALYKIDMTHSSPGAQVVNVSGRMYFEWRETCDAWQTDHRFNLVYEYADSPAMLITSDFSTWENFAGDQFYFNSRRSRDGEIYEELRGEAVRSEDGSGVATYSMPNGTEHDLPQGFVFPMQHTRQLIRTVQDDTPFLNRVLFDGSDLEGPIEVNAFVGANGTREREDSDTIDATLLSGAAYDVEMAFFPLAQEEIFAADYEMQALFHENSIIESMLIDYREFGIAQELVALEALPRPENCPSE